MEALGTFFKDQWYPTREKFSQFSTLNGNKWQMLDQQ